MAVRLAPDAGADTDLDRCRMAEAEREARMDEILIALGAGEFDRQEALKRAVALGYPPREAAETIDGYLYD